MNENTKPIVNVSKKAFVTAVIVLLAFMAVSAILTYVLPKGEFASEVTNGEVKVDYNTFIPDETSSGINIFKAIFSPILIFFADGFLQPLMLMIFLMCISAVFQIMSDCGGMGAIVSRIVNRFKTKRYAFIAVMIGVFMLLGSLFGLFEEVLVLLPMVLTVCVSLGFSPLVAFCVCTLATGFGFSVALTNPFTLVYASNIIGASPTKGIWFRILAFAVFYAIVFLFTYLASKKDSQKEVELSTLSDDNQAKAKDELSSGVISGDKKTFFTYTAFLAIVFISIITFSSISSLRDLSTPLLAAVFLIFGVTAGIIVFGVKNTFSSFFKGVVAVLPAMIMVCLAFAIKYILTEGKVLDTITHYITTAVAGKNKFATIMIVFAIILILEFFISSSTAKAVFVMGVLAGVMESGALALSKELLVLIYIFSDGFTNMLFPTSPVLLIGLSMTGQDYVGWLKKSKFLFLITFAVVILLLLLAMAIGY